MIKFGFITMVGLTSQLIIWISKWFFYKLLVNFWLHNYFIHEWTIWKPKVGLLILFKGWNDRIRDKH
jgi:hypothetical protein